jgi:hypothetical protein
MGIFHEICCGDCVYYNGSPHEPFRNSQGYGVCIHKPLPTIRIFENGPRVVWPHEDYQCPCFKRNKHPLSK